MTIALIAANVLVFLYQFSLSEQATEAFIAAFATVPAAISGAAQSASTPVPAGVTLLTSMFLHAGPMHLLWNMLFLWIFGNNVEDATGHLRFLLFYVACGFAATLAHVYTHAESITKLVGASGAISGVLGAYFLLYPHARIVTLLFLGFFAQTVQVPAFFFLGLWFLMQLLPAFLSVGAGGGGVAWFAHIGGFLAGMLLLVPFKRRRTRLWSQISG